MKLCGIEDTETQVCFHLKVTHTYQHTHSQTDRPPQKRKITTMGNLPRTGRDDDQDTDACEHSDAHTSKHTAVPQGQGSGNASLPSLGGDFISQHAFLMCRGNYPWAALRANSVWLLSSNCLTLSLSSNPLFTMTVTTHSLPYSPWLCHAVVHNILTSQS